jgi:hemerythrin
MALLLWDESLHINIEEIDIQHENLFRIINDLHESLQNSAGGDENTRSVLNSLLEDIILHYDSEERWMKKYNYPDYELHKYQHQQYISKIKDFVRLYKTEHTSLPAKDILISLAGWHSKHIIEYDKKFGRYVRECNED